MGLKKRLKIYELHYSNTNTYLIEGEHGRLLFDNGWAGSFPALCKALGEIKIAVQEINYILVSHYHPDHMGIVQNIADQGAVLLVPDLQKNYLHAADSIFEKESNKEFIPIRDDEARTISLDEGTTLLKELGISGKLIRTPGHSDDSISLYLDSGDLFVGDLNPLYELELHKGTQIEKSWSKLLALKPTKVYYGHAKTAVIDKRSETIQTASDKYALVSAMTKLIEKGYNTEKIRKKTGADNVFIQDVMRMYLTHQNISVQGILDRIEIKNR